MRIIEDLKIDLEIFLEDITKEPKKFPKIFLRSLQGMLNTTFGIPWKYVHPIRAYKQRRKIKQYVQGTYYEDCRYHPCKLIKIDNEGHMTGFDMVRGHESCCSLFHCGVVKLTKEEAEKRVEIIKTLGYDELYKYLNLDENNETKKT